MGGSLYFTVSQKSVSISCCEITGVLINLCQKFWFNAIISWPFMNLFRERSTAFLRHAIFGKVKKPKFYIRICFLHHFKITIVVENSSLHEHSDARRWKTLRGPVVRGGDNLPSPVPIGLTDLQNIGGASGPPCPTGSGFNVHGRVCPSVFDGSNFGIKAEHI